MSFIKGHFLAITVGAIWISIFLIFYLTLYILGLAFEEFVFLVYNFMRENMLLGTFLFLALFTIRPLVFIPASPFDLFAGAIFGVWWGSFICIIAYSISCVFSYGVGRATGGTIFERIPEASRIKKLRGKIQANTFFTLTMMRLLFFPFDLTNYLCGVSKMPLRPFAFGTILGGIPGIMIFVLAGAAFHGQEINSLSEVSQNVNYSYLFLASGLFLVSIVFSKVLKQKYKW
ncbi:VTT domain-containing protein [Candidatus Gracilibacteria bacterium]|nr:VTT domain-containing protein [Candidatus Gracilibacteria bacterium]